jgi:hypothetical protein
MNREVIVTFFLRDFGPLVIGKWGWPQEGGSVPHPSRSSLEGDAGFDWQMQDLIGYQVL